MTTPQSRRHVRQDQPLRGPLLPEGHPAARVFPLRTEQVGRSLRAALGGDFGRFAAVGRTGWWTPLRVLIAIGLSFMALAYTQKAACLGGKITDSGVSLNWDGNRQYAAACYSDIIPLYSGRGLNQPGFVYAYSWQDGDLTRYMEYPVLGGLFQGMMGWISRNTYPVIQFFTDTVPAASWYFTLTALVIATIWVLTIRMVALLAGNRVWDTVLVAASPLLIVHGLTNWDLPSVAFAVGAMLAVKRSRPGLAGVLIGLGTAFKLWPLYLLGAYLILAVRSKKWAQFLKMAGLATVSWLVVNVPIMLRYPDAWREFLRLNSERSWEWTTIYAVISRATGWAGFDTGGGEPVILNTLTFLLFAAGCLAIFLFGVFTSRRPRVAELVALIIIAFLLVNKVWSPQYSLWLLVPAVLALPRWRLILTWAIVDMCGWPILMWHMMGTDNRGAPGWLLNIAVLGRDALIIAIAVGIIFQMLGRTHDKVRAAHGGLDPLAGCFGQTDAPGLRRRPIEIQKES